MPNVAFCSRCRRLRVGWNSRYMLHLLTCKEWISRSSKLMILMVLLAILAFAFPTTSAIFFSDGGGQNGENPVIQATTVSLHNSAVDVVDAFLAEHRVEDVHRGRIASAIVRSSRKYNFDPRLIASIIIVESRANPFAISQSHSVGIMQVHLPTWGLVADREGINLLKIEDNVDFGARILRDYSRRFGGVWEGVKRYKGWTVESPESMRDVEAYLEKIRTLYASKT